MSIASSRYRLCVTTKKLAEPIMSKRNARKRSPTMLILGDSIMKNTLNQMPAKADTKVKKLKTRLNQTFRIGIFALQTFDLLHSGTPLAEVSSENPAKKGSANNCYLTVLIKGGATASTTQVAGRVTTPFKNSILCS